MPNNELKTLSPEQTSKNELDQFIALVTEGGEVTKGLKSRVMRAHSLTMINHDGKIQAVAALKIPYNSYRKKVFKKSGCQECPETFTYEIGWIYVSPSCRGMKYASHLVSACLEQAGRSPTFATTRTENKSMQHSLKKEGFSICGKPYPSTQSTESEVNLLVWRKF